MKKKLSIILATGFSTIALAGAVAASAVTLTSCSEVTYLTDTNVNDMYTGIKDSTLFTNIDKTALPNNPDMVVALNDYFSGKKEANTEAKPAAESETTTGPTSGNADANKPASVPEQLIKAAAKKANVPENAIQAVEVKVSEKKTEQPASRAGEVSSEQQSTPSYQAVITIQFGDADVSKLTENNDFTLNSNRSKATFKTPIAITFKGDNAGTPPLGDGGSHDSEDGVVSGSTIDINKTQAGDLFASLNNILTTIPEASVNTPSVSADTINTYLKTPAVTSELLKTVQKTNGITGIGNEGVVTGVTVEVKTAPTINSGDATYSAGTANVTITFGAGKVNLANAGGANDIANNDNTSLTKTGVAINIAK